MAVKKFLQEGTGENKVQVWPITRADCVYNVEGTKLLNTVVDEDRQARIDADDALDGRLDVIEGEGEGSIKKAIADEVAARDTAIDEAVTFENGITTVNSLGGIPAGKSLDGMTANEILDMLLFPYVKQTISNVKGTPNGGTFEHGNNQVITQVQATVTKKSKPITKVELLQGNTVLATKEGDEVAAGGTFTFSGLNVAVDSVNVQLKVKAYDSEGSVVEGSTGAFSFIYPYYTGICEAGAVIDEALVEGLTKKIEAKGNKAWSFTTNNQCAVIAYPKSYGVLKSALDPNAFENISAFTRHEVSVTGLDGNAVAYYVYVSGAFTGSGFKYTFKY